MPSSQFPTPAAPLVGGSGRVRVTPLTEAVAARLGGNASGANRAPAGPATSSAAKSAKGDAGLSSSDANTPDPSVEDVQAAIQQADQGDQASIDWLKTLGLVGLIGTGLGTAAIARTLQQRKKLGADDIAVDAAASNVDSTSSEKPKALPAPAEQKYLPKPAAKALPAPTTVYQGQGPQPLALPNPNAGVVVTPPPAAKPPVLQLTDQNAAGRAKAAQAEREGWAARLSGKFKASLKANPALARGAVSRAVR